MFIRDLDEKCIKKLKKLKNVHIQRKIVTTHMRTSNTTKNIDLYIKTNTNSVLGNVEDWLTFEGDSKWGFPKTFYYSFYSQERLEEMESFFKSKI